MKKLLIVLLIALSSNIKSSSRKTSPPNVDQIMERLSKLTIGNRHATNGKSEKHLLRRIRLKNIAAKCAANQPPSSSSSARKPKEPTFSSKNKIKPSHAGRNSSGKNKCLINWLFKPKNQGARHKLASTSSSARKPKKPTFSRRPLCSSAKTNFQLQKRRCEQETPVINRNKKASSTPLKFGDIQYANESNLSIQPLKKRSRKRAPKNYE